MSSYPKISIITPSFNQGQYLEETILSVINQDYPNLEYIIIDGGSTDNSVEIIKKYEDKLAFWVSEKDKGQSDAINKGIKKVTGDIFNWLNSDDYLEPGALHLVARMFENNAANVFCGKANHFGVGIDYQSDVSTFFDVKNDVAIVPRINQPATFFKTEVIRRLGPLNDTFHYCMDLEWWMKYLFLYGHTQIEFSSAVLVNFREHNSSKTMSQSDKFVYDKCLLLAGILSKKRGKKNPFGHYQFELSLNDFSLEFLDRMVVKDLLMGLVVFYGKRDFEKVEIVLKMINPEYLEPKDKKEFNKIRNRMRFVPKILLKLRKATN